MKWKLEFYYVSELFFFNSAECFDFMMKNNNYNKNKYVVL